MYSDRVRGSQRTYRSDSADITAALLTPHILSLTHTLILGKLCVFILGPVTGEKTNL